MGTLETLVDNRIFNAAQPDVGRVQVLGSKKLQEPVCQSLCPRLMESTEMHCIGSEYDTSPQGFQSLGLTLAWETPYKGFLDRPGGT